MLGRHHPSSLLTFPRLLHKRSSSPPSWLSALAARNDRLRPTLRLNHGCRYPVFSSPVQILPKSRSQPPTSKCRIMARPAGVAPGPECLALTRRQRPGPFSYLRRVRSSPSALHHPSGPRPAVYSPSSRPATASERKDGPQRRLCTPVRPPQVGHHPPPVDVLRMPLGPALDDL